MNLDRMALERFEFQHGSLSLEIEAASNLDALLTDVTDPERIPYWAVIWESAPALSRWLLDRECWRGREVLELGCGSGLLGLCLAAAGARVMQTDRFPEAAVLARSNMRRNRISGVRHVAADWSAWPLCGRWPVVVGSDLLYERRCQGWLLKVLGEALADGGEAFLADPGRPMSADFPDLASAGGWDVEKAEIGVDVYRLRRRATAR